MPETLFILSSFDQAKAVALFNDTSRRIQMILPVKADIQHVGATAVPRCLSKGDVDLCVRVSQEAFVACDNALQRHFERNIASERCESFSSFNDRAADIGIQLVVRGAPLDVFIRFRDLLRRNPELLACYNQLKQRYNGKPMTEYRSAKDQFIHDALSSF